MRRGSLSCVPLAALLALALSVQGWVAPITLPAAPPGEFTEALASDFSTTSNSLSFSGLSFAVDANRKYHFHATLIFRSGATPNGVRLAFTAPSGATGGYRTERMIVNASGDEQAIIGVLGSTEGFVTAGVPAINTDYEVLVTGWVLTTGSAGGLAVMFACEDVGVPGCTLKAGSAIRYQALTNY
jgi:hypothetical protein